MQKMAFLKFMKAVLRRFLEEFFFPKFNTFFKKYIDN